MNVRKKTLAIACISVVVVILFTSSIFNHVMFGYIDNIEKTDIDENYRELNSILQREHDNLYRTALDWAHWDETYNFMQGKNVEDYIENNLQADSLRQLNVNFMYFYSIKGNLANVNIRNVDSNKIQLISSQLAVKVKTKSKSNSNGSFLLNAEGNIYIISYANITTTNEQAESAGVLVVGKQIDITMMSYINSVIINKVRIGTAQTYKRDSDETYKRDSKYIIANRRMQDINGKESINFSVTMPRDEYNTGKTYLEILALVFVVLLIVTSVIAVFLFDKQVLERLKAVNSFFEDIAQTKNTYMRLNMNGNDEITKIANSANRMLNELEKRNMELINLSYHDKLTGLKNRAYMDKCFSELDNNKKINYSIIMGDVNGLKLVNDTFGHKEGDKLICCMAKKLAGVVEEDDIVGRWCGDEFIVITKNKDEQYVDKLIKKINREFNKVSNCGFVISMALGSANSSEILKASEVMNIAEENMYRCKIVEAGSSRNATIRLLQKTLYEKHHDTEEHTQRVKELSTKLGEQIGLSQEKLNQLELLSLLHDIGKIGIPEHILMKPGKLTNEEWETMKRHTEIGYRIAKATPGLEHVANEILSHHERYDGTGYPRGLKGEEIPILSRIINIADSFDVMTHKRVYKDANDCNYAIEELERCSGTQFDPVLVEQFLKLLNEEKNGS